MKLSIITLTYNQLKYTKQYVESLYKYTKDFELIIVDNGSTDGTVEYLRELQDKGNVKLIFNSENLGFSKGNNQGIEIAEGEYIGFLNNDILLYPNWFEECEKVFLSENAGFVSPMQVNPHFDRTNSCSYIKYFSNKKFVKSYSKSFDDCTFSCVITKRSVLDKVGKLDENYSPAFFEDNDIKYRTIEAGYDVFVCNTVCFFHFGSITSERINYKFKENEKYYYSKYPFAEYLSLNGQENVSLKLKVRDLERFPLNVIYNNLVFLRKVKNKLKRILK